MAAQQDDRSRQTGCCTPLACPTSHLAEALGGVCVLCPPPSLLPRRPRTTCCRQRRTVRCAAAERSRVAVFEAQRARPGKRSWALDRIPYARDTVSYRNCSGYQRCSWAALGVSDDPLARAQHGHFCTRQYQTVRPRCGRIMHLSLAPSPLWMESGRATAAGRSAVLSACWPRARLGVRHARALGGQVAASGVPRHSVLGGVRAWSLLLPQRGVYSLCPG